MVNIQKYNNIIQELNATHTTLVAVSKIKPAAGTVRSFTIKGDHVVGGSRRYVASFDPKTGESLGYGWDKDISQTYDDYLNAVRKNIQTNLEHENDPMWDPDLPGDQAGKRALGLWVGLALPNPILKRATVAVNAKNVATASQDGFKVEGQLTKIWSERNFFVNYSNSKYIGSIIIFSANASTRSVIVLQKNNF